MNPAVENRRETSRLACEPRPIDLCSLGSDLVFYQMKVVDESTLGLGCICEGEFDPDVGAQLDWCGLKRFEVRWVKKDKVGPSRVGLMSA